MSGEIKIVPSVSATCGAEVLKTEGTSYNVAKAGLGLNIPIGQTIEIEPEIYTRNSDDINNVGEIFNFSKQITSNLSLSTGIGLNKTKFASKEPEYSEYDYADGRLTPDQGEEVLLADGDFYENGTVFTVDKDRKDVKEMFLSAGAKYKLNNDVTFSAGLKIGQKEILGPIHEETKVFEGERVIKGKTLQLIQYDDDWSDYGWVGKVVTEKYSGTETTIEEMKNKAYTGGISGIVEYKLSNNLSAKIDGTLGLGKYADSNVGLNIKFKF